MRLVASGPVSSSATPKALTATLRCVTINPPGSDRRDRVDLRQFFGGEFGVGEGGDGVFDL